MLIEKIATESGVYWLATHRRYDGRLVVAEGKCRQSAMDACLRMVFGADKPIRAASDSWPPLRVVK